jgi:hypothetical protein
MSYAELRRGALRLLRVIATLPILLYRYLISPLLPQTCIYHPSCSSYAQEAILTHGVLRGLALGIARVFRCSSLFTGGYDPVPAEFSFHVIKEGYRAHRDKPGRGDEHEEPARERADADAADGASQDAAQREGGAE